MTVIEDGDDAIGATFSTPDKQVYDNTLNNRSRISAAEGTISSQGLRLTTAEGEIDALQTTVGDHGSRLTDLESDVSAVETDLDKRMRPGRLRGSFDVAGTLSPSFMLTLVQDSVGGENATRPGIGDYNNGAAADKVIALAPNASLYDLFFHATCAFPSLANVSASTLIVEQDTSDAFASPTEIGQFTISLAEAATSAECTFSGALLIDSTEGRFLRFLIPTPNAAGVVVEGKFSVVCKGSAL